MDKRSLDRLKSRVFEGFPISLIITNPKIEDNPIVYVNRSFETLTGYAAESAIGRNCRFLQGPDTDRDLVRQIGDAVRAGRPHRAELINYRADGSSFINRLTIEPILDEHGQLAAFLGLQSSVDRSEERDRRVEAQLNEVQHRVKNHLQMVVSMIRLQSKRAEKDKAAEDYENLAYRVETLQLLYQELMKADDGTSVPMGAYLSRIATAIGHLEGRENIRLNIDTQSFYVSVEVAVRVGLLASELITNAYQHAFEDRKAGLVEVSLRQLSGGIMRLRVSDDGIGMPEGIKWPQGNSMGATVARSLLEGINGQVDIARGVAGTSITVDVPLSLVSEQYAN